jgi:hypothetical protein
MSNTREPAQRQGAPEQRPGGRDDQGSKPGVGQPGRGGENFSGEQPPKTDSRHAQGGRRSKYGPRGGEGGTDASGTATPAGPSTSAGPGSESIGGPAPT